MNITANRENHFDKKRLAVCQAPAQTCGATDAAEVRAPASYYVPEQPFRDWVGEELLSFAPNARQQIVMDAVAKALDAGLSSNIDVNVHVAATLKVPADVLARYTVRSEHGDFGSDVYMARKAVKAQRKNADRQKIAGEMRLTVGDKLGTLVFSDFKRDTSTIVESVSENGLAITITGKRGSARVRIKPCPLQLKDAINRAHERGSRKDSYLEFVASRQPVATRAKKSAESACSKKQAPLTKQQLDQLLVDERTQIALF